MSSAVYDTSQGSVSRSVNQYQCNAKFHSDKNQQKANAEDWLDSTNSKGWGEADLKPEVVRASKMTSQNPAIQWLEEQHLV